MREDANDREDARQIQPTIAQEWHLLYKCTKSNKFSSTISPKVLSKTKDLTCCFVLILLSAAVHSHHDFVDIVWTGNWSTPYTYIHTYMVLSSLCSVPNRLTLLPSINNKDAGINSRPFSRHCEAVSDCTVCKASCVNHRFYTV